MIVVVSCEAGITTFWDKITKHKILFLQYKIAQNKHSILALLGSQPFGVEKCVCIIV